MVLDRRQLTDDVDEHPPQELLVGANVRRHDPEFLELGVDERVDVVELGHRRERELQPLRQDDHLGADGERGEPGHDERLAPVAGRDRPVGRDLRGDGVTAEEQGEVRHVAEGAVRVFRPDGHPLLLVLAVEHHRRRVQFDRDRLGHVRRVLWGAGFQPADESLVRLVAGLEPLAAGVRYFAGRLLDHQALGRDRDVDAATRHLAAEAVVIAVGVEAEQ
jgi:hypothetical protein